MIKKKSTKNKKIKLEDIVKKENTSSNKKLYEEIIKLIDKRAEELRAEHSIKDGSDPVKLAKNEDFMVDNEFICYIAMVDKNSNQLLGRTVTYCSGSLINDAIKKLMTTYIKGKMKATGVVDPLDELLLRSLDE